MYTLINVMGSPHVALTQKILVDPEALNFHYHLQPPHEN